MSKVLLVSANTNMEPVAVYPLGMALVDAALQRQGHETRQFDCLYDREVQNRGLSQILDEFRPDVVGVSVRNIDNVDSMSTKDNWYLSRVREIVAQIRRNLAVPVVLGGPAVSIMPETILNYTGADYCIVGEGEVAFNLLIQKIKNNDAPPRIMGPLAPRMETRDFCSPAYHGNLVSFYNDQSGMVNYQTKRGCPFGCNYCSYPLIEGKKFRHQDIGLVIENLKRLKTDHNVRTLFFTDSVFNDPGGRFLELAQAMVRADLGIKWAAYFRPDEISMEDLLLLKRSGLYAVELGSDAACDTTLAGIGKTFDFSRITAFNDGCIKAEIPCAHFFMFGGPGETLNTIDEGLTNIAGLKKTVAFVFSGIRILPGTALVDIAVREGIIRSDDTLINPTYYVAPGVDKSGMDEKITRAFFRKKDRFFPPEKGQMRMKALQAFGFKGLLWDMVLKMPTGKRRASCKKLET